MDKTNQLIERVINGEDPFFVVKEAVEKLDSTFRKYANEYYNKVKKYVSDN
jgi:hypothetical protein